MARHKKRDEDQREDPADEAVDPTGPETPLSDAALAALQERASKADEFEESWLRSAADLQNLQRRSTRDKDLARKMAVRDLIGALLPCFDNLERAVVSADSSSLDAVVEGVSMVSTEIRRVLSDHGVQVIDPTGDDRMDPMQHEAVFSRHEDEVEENVILEVHERGYAIGEVVIRPARVTVYLGPAEQAEPTDDTDEAPQED